MRPARGHVAASAEDAWLTVLMPTLNGAAYVEAALSSVAAQGAGVHVVVVDGGSTDATVAMARRFADVLSLTVIERADSPGWVWSTNLALGLARTPYACLLHQDDLWLDGRAAKMAALAAENPDAPLLLCDTRFIDPAGRDVGAWSCPWSNRSSRRWRGGRRMTSAQILAALLIQDFLACPAPVFRTEAARAAGGLDETLWYTADWDFWLKLAGRGTVAYLAEPLAAFRVHPASLTVTGSGAQRDFAGQMDRVLDRHQGALADRAARRRAVRAGRFSNAVNATLARRYHGGEADWWALARRAVGLGPVGLARYLRCSRITQRVGSRLRAGFV